MAAPLYETILRQARQLTPEELTRLRDDIAELARDSMTTSADQQAEATDGASPTRPLRSLYGALADLGPAPSAGEIDEMRREAWASWSTDDP